MCFSEASREYGVPELLLRATAQVESSNNPRAIGKNPGGTRDLGLMQINSSHLDRLSKWNITEKELLNDPCLNLKVGAWVMSENIRRHGYNWTAVGAYNVGCAKLAKNECERRRNIYAGKIYRAMGQIEKNGQRNVAQGWAQTKQVAYAQTVAPEPGISSVKFGRSDKEVGGNES